MKNNSVSYYYDSSLGTFEYHPKHPMKPFRVKMTHDLILNYGLYREMDCRSPLKASYDTITAFHDKEYIEFLKSINLQLGDNNINKFNLGEDCPPFAGLFEFCQLTTGATICAANRINRGDSKIAINWAGGLHHAKKAEASGFCYVNDIVCGILELLKVHKRVLYIDIDCHHGDGVEEAFYLTNRVMTVSFHKYGNFFPGTGHMDDVGLYDGKNYSINVPLNKGIDDFQFEILFQAVVSRTIEQYKPEVIVLQSGADSLSGDRLGCFNLSLAGHSSAIKYLKTVNIPLVVLGGGGYTIKNVARAWAYETSLIVDKEIKSGTEIPSHENIEMFGPDYLIDVPISNMANCNKPEHLEDIVNIIYENLNTINSPSVELREIPMDIVSEKDEEDETYIESLRSEYESSLSSKVN